ncbi:alternate gene name: yzbB [Pseudoalteromonas luteoviolacea B = ATCC 29581]|nr:alternate gene name: yzbB [Pseudoalteromonas luteoviolacea B = ATCC 29581]
MTYRIYLFLLFSVFQSSVYALTLGIEQHDTIHTLLQKKRVGLIVNHTSSIEDIHLVDLLLKQGIDVRKIFTPEHGFRGDQDAGAPIENGTDAKTGLPLISLYGDMKKPSNASLSELDVLLFDIQDVGARFYTYISTMHYAMEAAAENGLQFIVLDRPNPNIRYVDGPILESQFSSFVGLHPIPVLHGMTVGELAKMIKGERWINQAERLDLTVVAMKDYSSNIRYTLPIAPSPNLPNSKAIQLYPSLCFFEGTAVSIGRGTDHPFQLFGHHQVKLGPWEIIPKPNAGASKPKLNGARLFASDLRDSVIQGLDLRPLIESYRAFEQQGELFFTSKSFFDKLAGTDKLRLAIEQGHSAEQIRASWAADLKHFEKRRAAYLLYPRLSAQDTSSSN